MNRGTVHREESGSPLTDGANVDIPVFPTGRPCIDLSQLVSHQDRTACTTSDAAVFAPLNRRLGLVAFSRTQNLTSFRSEDQFVRSSTGVI